MKDRIHELLFAWFGVEGTSDLPTSDRTNFWFGEDNIKKKEVMLQFQQDYEKAVAGNYMEWENSSRGRLALIILLDQFPRYLHSKSASAFKEDEKAQFLCLDGIKKNMDQSLTLIERVFFYMPLVHAENNELQEQSIRLYQELTVLSMPETVQIYQLFLAYAYAHFKVIKEFGRFPQRNLILNRTSTDKEVTFLQNK